MLLWSTSMFLWGGCSSSSSEQLEQHEQFEQQQQQLELQQLVQRQRKKLKVHENWEESLWLVALASINLGGSCHCKWASA